MSTRTKQPAKLRINLYREQAAGFTFSFFEDETPMTEPPEGLSFRVFALNRELQPKLKPQILSQDNIASILFTPEQTIELLGNQYYFELRDPFRVYMRGNLTVNRAPDNSFSESQDYNIIIEE